MTEHTPRFRLPFIVPGQAQKELFHNEALVAVDALLHPAIAGGPIAVPPAAPDAGDSWLVAAGASGAWQGRDHNLATWTEGGWRFAAPAHGMRVWNRAEALWLQWEGNGWNDGELRGARLVVGGRQVVGERQPSVPSPSGGTIIDAEARATIAALIVALRSHGLID